MENGIRCKILKMIQSPRVLANKRISLLWNAKKLFQVIYYNALTISILADDDVMVSLKPFLSKPFISFLPDELRQYTAFIKE